MNNYEPVIGIEVHVELNTKTKMFCRCSADYFGEEPNSHTCPVCLGLPGALPYINEEAIKKCMQIGLALNCEINEQSYFERKNYFYPDLAKGYQISQYKAPLCAGGWMEISPFAEATGDKEGLEKSRRIRINRVHQEEDTAKLIHQFGNQNYSLLDFNRSGVPLVEIVTEPDFYSSAQVKDYAQKLQQIFRHIGVSNADMERGDMRLEANVSVRQVKSDDGRVMSQELSLPPYRVELKNINSFRFMVAAIEYEIKRQSEALERGETLTQETRGWNESKKETFLQRSKEEAHDYRYFPEPDLPELRVKSEEERVKSLKEELKGKLPQEQADALVLKYGILEKLAAMLIKQGTAELFEEVVRGLPHFAEASWGKGGKEGLEINAVANYIINRGLSPTTPPPDIISALKSKTSSLVVDKYELEKAIDEALNENQDAVGNYKAGKTGALQFLTGQALRKTRGRGNPSEIAKKILEKLRIEV